MIIKNIDLCIEINLNTDNPIFIMKELFELFGLILGDGSYYLDRGKYPHMCFFNFDRKIVERARRICEKIAKKKIKISSRKRKTGVELSFTIPTSVTKKLIELGFNKKKLPASIINHKHSIFLLKGLYQSDGSCHGSRICIYQKNKEELLKDCQKIANLNGFPAHIHNLNRNGEQVLVIENINKLKKIWKDIGKPILEFKPKINGYWITKRAILKFLKGRGWKKTSQIHEHLLRNGIRLKRNALLNKHLKKLFELGIIEKQASVIKRNKRGQFEKSECRWKLRVNLSEEQILNFPYGVIK